MHSETTRVTAAAEQNHAGPSDEARMVSDAADRILREQCTGALIDAAEAGAWPASLWATLVEAGLPLASAPERFGGSELPLAEGLSLLRLAGMHALPLPLAESMLASALLGATTCENLPPGPLIPVVAGPADRVTARDVDGRVVIDARIERVPFAPCAGTLLLVLPAARGPGTRLALVPIASLRLDTERTIAGEPAATITLTDHAVDASACHDVALEPQRIRARLALGRALMIAGGLQSILDMSCAYALDRTQFGRPLAAFQAIQQQLAVLAGEAAAAIRAADRALEALGGDDELIEIAVAKARAGEAAGRGAEIAHQVHGAMGFTHEHALHQRTRRLWSWRDQHGNESEWQAWLGRRICAEGADQLWSFVTRSG